MTTPTGDGDRDGADPARSGGPGPVRKRRFATKRPSATKDDGWRKRVLIVAGVYLLVVVGFAWYGLDEHYSGTVAAPVPVGPGGLPVESPDRCPPGDPPAGGAAAPKLAPRGAPVDSIAFGRSLGTQVREFDFTLVDALPGGTTCLHTQAGPFLRIGDDDTAQLPATRIATQATVIGRQVHLVVAVMRTDPRVAPSGTYTGTVGIDDPRVDPVDVPLTVSLAYPVWQLPLVVLLLTLPAAIGYLWLLKGSFHGQQHGANKITLTQFDDYAFSRNGILAIGYGVASTIVVFSATYLRSPTWGASFVDAVALFGAMFTAFAAASTPVTAAGSDRYDPLAVPSNQVGGQDAAPRDDPTSSTGAPAAAADAAADAAASAPPLRAAPDPRSTTPS